MTYHVASYRHRQVKLAEATATVKTVPQGRYAEAEVFFG